MPQRFHVGFDPSAGKSHPCALAVIEERFATELSGRATAHVDVVHMQRDHGLSFDDQVAMVQRVMDRLHHVGATLSVDASGVGLAVVQGLRARGARLNALTWTGGSACTAERVRGGWDANVAKALVFRSLGAHVFAGRLKIAASDPLAAQLVRELADVQLRITASGREQYEAGDGADGHGDIVAAVGMAVWWAEHSRPLQRVRAAHHDFLSR